MRRMRAAGAAIVVCLALGGVPAVAQSPSPVQGHQEAGKVTAVTGRTTASTTDTSQEQWSQEGGIGHARAFKVISTVEWSDPRLPSHSIGVANFDMYQIGVFRELPYQAAILLEGPEGTWTGTETGYFDSDGNQFSMRVLSGNGAYEGLFAVIRQTLWTDPARASESGLEGMIYEGVMPPMPDPVEPPAE